MRLLLDTQLLLWALAQPEKLERRLHDVIGDPENEVAFSAASIWEVAIKASLGRPDFTARPEDVTREAIAAGFTELPVRAGVASLVADLPHHHGDPFDRLLIAQAMAGPIRLYTTDPLLPPYSELVTLVPRKRGPRSRPA